MHRFLFLLIGLFFGAGLGFFWAASNGITLDGHDHDAHPSAGHAEVSRQTGADSAHAHHDAPIELANDASRPSVAATLLADPVSGWNLEVSTTNFEFAPEKAGAAHVTGQGHAHVYADDQKIARLYGSWMHIAALPDGARELRVTLNSNDHRTLAVDGVAVETRLTIPES